MAITAQEAWVDRDHPIEVPAFVREIVEEVAFQARNERKIDKRSGVSQRMPISVLESLVSNAERRALVHGESPVVARVIDLYAALPSMTGKFELEYEGELKGADIVARELVRAAVSTVFDGYFPGRRRAGGRRMVRPGRDARISATRSRPADVVAQARGVQGLIELAHRAGIAPDASAPLLAAAIDFVLEGLYSQKKIGRTDDGGYHGTEPVRRRETRSVAHARADAGDDDEEAAARQEEAVLQLRRSEAGPLRRRSEAARNGGP